MTVNRLVALDMPASFDFANHVRNAWESGDAVFPVDQRLPQSAKESLIEQFKPSVVIDASGNSVDLPNPEPTAHYDALVIATSGSTGAPKGVVHTHDSIRALLDMSQSPFANRFIDTLAVMSSRFPRCRIQHCGSLGSHGQPDQHPLQV